MRAGCASTRGDMRVSALQPVEPSGRCTSPCGDMRAGCASTRGKNDGGVTNMLYLCWRKSQRLCLGNRFEK